MKKLIIIVAMFMNALVLGNDQIGQEIEAVLKTAYRGGNFHGNILIKKGQSIAYRSTQGLANREWQVPHQQNSKFMIASLTKQFTAYAVLNLAKEGKLSIQDPVSKFIELPKRSPIDPNDWNKITLFHLLTHTSGLIRDIRRNDFMSTSDYNILGTIVHSVLNAGKIIYDPPGSYSYSNLGYLLLAQVIEKTTKSEYITYLKKQIFNPLQMNDTDEFHRRKSILYMAEGYFAGENRTTSRRCCHDASLFTGSHGLYSTINDLEIWMGELHGKSNILKREILEQMKQIQVPIDDQSSYGFGLVIDEIEGMQRIGHTGHEWGYVSVMSYIPELDLTLILLSNYHGNDIFERKANHLKFQDGIVTLFKNR